MSEGFASSSRKMYGATSEVRVPDVGYVGSQFSPTEMYDLCENITTNIYTINASWRQLDQAMKTIGTPKDNQGLRDKVHVTQLSSNQIIAQTTKDLQRLTVVVRRGDKQQKLQVEKLTNNFKEAVQIYSRVQKQVAEKMKVNILSRKTSVSGGEESGSGVGGEAADEERRRLSAQQSLQRELEFDQGLLVEREQRVRQIEGDILDVNQIMRELSAMVHQQGETLNTIENSIDNTYGGIESAQQELQKAAAYQEKRRRRTCCLLAISVAVGLFLALVIALSLH